MRSPRRLAVTAVALLSVGVTMLLFIRATAPSRVTQLAAARAHLTDADMKALASPIDYRDAVPVVTFHDVSARSGPYSLSPARFATALTALRKAGFHSVSLAQVRDVVQGRHPALPSRPMLITFDDGVGSEYTTADPILKANGFSAVSFLPVSRIGDGRRPSYYLSWPQVRAMAGSGRWQFQVRAEDGDLPVAATRLRAATGSDVYACSYTSRLRRRLTARSFTLGFVSDPHAPLAVDDRSDALRLPRLEVTSQLDVTGLFAALRRMVPSPPAPDLGGWSLHGDACTVSGDRLTISAAGYALCRSDLNGGQWTDYRMQVTVTGLADRTTLVVICRANAAGDLELSVGARRAVLRQSVHGKYVVLAAGPTAPPGTDGSHAVVVDVVGARATVIVDGVTIGTEPIDAALGYGGPGFGIAGGGSITIAASVTDLRARPAGP